MTTSMPSPWTRILGIVVALLVIVALAPATALADDDEWDDGSDGWYDNDRETDGESVGPTYADGSLHKIVRTTGARKYWRYGYTGAGIDVAVIDTGVSPVSGLDGPGKIVNGPDLSFESQADNLRYLDTNGHGTHLASIIAGKDQGVGNPLHAGDDDFVGVAPNARIVNVKVGDAMGAVDVSQVIAAINWVTEHKNDNGLNIRVLNLSFGTDSVQDHEIDPLAYAVEQAWNAGIVVVTATGNDGNGAPLRNPAKDPFVIAVGANDDNGTRRTDDDVIPSYSNCGTSARHTDLVAPGTSIEGLRNPNSDADQEHPGARVGQRKFKGSGTSQSAAVVSGAAALILEQRPHLTPDQVKRLLKRSARNIDGASDLCQGKGTLNMRRALWADDPGTRRQPHNASDGSGSLEAARGSAHVEIDGVVLEGEQDIHGEDFDAAGHAWATSQGLSWSGGDWNGLSWSGLSWSGLSWSGLSWSGLSWSGLSWSGLSWSGLSWSSNTWNGLSWSGLSWSDHSWSSVTWSGDSWSTDTWSTGVWAGLSWK